MREDDGDKDKWWEKLIYLALTAAVMVPVYWFIAKPFGQWTGGLMRALIGR